MINVCVIHTRGYRSPGIQLPNKVEIKIIRIKSCSNKGSYFIQEHLLMENLHSPNISLGFVGWLSVIEGWIISYSSERDLSSENSTKV